MKTFLIELKNKLGYANNVYEISWNRISQLQLSVVELPWKQNNIVQIIILCAKDACDLILTQHVQTAAVDKRKIMKI